MSRTIKANDYLYISGRIHAMENRLLTRERMERMLEARTAEEAAKVLQECGYEEMTALTPSGLERLLAGQRLALFRELRSAAPDPGLLDVFAIQYDYHNAKVLLKSEAAGREAERLLLDAGRYPAAQLMSDYHEDDLRRYAPAFAAAVTAAKETLNRTGDPQLADFVLDRAYFEELTAAARDTGSQFLQGYVSVRIDSANLRAAVRSARMNKGADFLDQVLLPGGSIPVEKVRLAALGAADLAGLYAHTVLEEAAQEGAKVLHGGSLTAFEKRCDDAVTHYLAAGKRVAYGEHPLIGYLYAREMELTTVRIILTGKLAGLDEQVIRERLRESYV